MNFKKLCSDFLKSHSKIRFVGVLDSRGHLIAQKNRDVSTALLSTDEFKMLLYYTSDRRNRLQNLQHKLGKVKDDITNYENASIITFILDKNLLLISTDPNSNNSKISSDLWKIIGKKPTKKKPLRRKPTKKKPAKKKPLRRKPTKKKPAKKKPAKKKPLKRKPIKKRVSQKRRTTKKVSRRPVRR
jgi:hypothetical protein